MTKKDKILQETQAKEEARQAMLQRIEKVKHDQKVERMHILIQMTNRKQSKGVSSTALSSNGFMGGEDEEFQKDYQEKIIMERLHTLADPP